MLIERIKADFEHKDERGTLVQLVHGDYPQVNVITSKSGVMRGGHYHKQNTEAFYVAAGSCKVTACWHFEKECVVFTAGDFFRIGPHVVHDFEYLEDSVLVAMYSLGVELENGTKDIFVPGINEQGIGQ